MHHWRVKKKEFSCVDYCGPPRIYTFTDIAVFTENFQNSPVLFNVILVVVGHIQIVLVNRRELRNSLVTKRSHQKGARISSFYFMGKTQMT